jgi:AIPR protein
LIPEVQSAIDDINVHIKIILAYPGDPLSDPQIREFKELLEELNGPSGDVASFTLFNLREIHRAVSGMAKEDEIDFDIPLMQWGQIDEPYKSFYGYLNCTEINTLWEQYGQRLFHKNIRKFLGDTNVNEGIKETLVNHPDYFYYFNNGITMLCNKLTKKVVGGGDRTVGIFHCEGVHVVNGAQTVGSIGNVYLTKPDAVDKAKIFLRIISLENCPEGYDAEITRANNTQNKIEKRDFVSLDPVQERIRLELFLEGKTYSYKSGEELISKENGCDLKEATVALACSSEQLQYAIWSKKEIGKLWDDIQKQPYKLLFNDSLDGYRLWRLVLILRVINETLDIIKNKYPSGPERGIAVHGNCFIGFVVFKKLNMEEIMNYNLNISKKVAQLTEEVYSSIVSVIDDLFPNAVIGRLFYNMSKSETIFKTITNYS